MLQPHSAFPQSNAPGTHGGCPPSSSLRAQSVPFGIDNDMTVELEDANTDVALDTCNNGDDPQRKNRRARGTRGGKRKKQQQQRKGVPLGVPSLPIAVQLPVSDHTDELGIDGTYEDDEWTSAADWTQIPVEFDVQEASSSVTLAELYSQPFLEYFYAQAQAAAHHAQSLHSNTAHSALAAALPSLLAGGLNYCSYYSPTLQSYVVEVPNPPSTYSSHSTEEFSQYNSDEQYATQLQAMLALEEFQKLWTSHAI